MRWVLLSLFAFNFAFASTITVHDKENPKRMAIEFSGVEAKTLYENLDVQEGNANVSVKGIKKEFVSEKSGKNIMCFQDPFTKKKDKFTCWLNLGSNGRASKWDREKEQRVELRLDQSFLFKSGGKVAEENDEVVKVICDPKIEKSRAFGNANGARGPSGENSTLRLKPGEAFEFQDANKNYLSIACLKS